MTQSWPNSELSEPFHVQSWTALSGVTYTVARRSPAVCRLVTLVYTFINLPCTDDDVMHWWWCHALKLVTYSKIPSCTKKDPRYFFWPFTTEFSFYLKGWNNNSGQESRELIHVFLSPFIVSVTFGRKPGSWAGATVEADDEESIKHRLFFSYIKHQLNCLPFQQT